MHPEPCRNAARFHIQQADTLDSNIRICFIKVENEVCYGYPTPQRACESELSVNGGRRFLGYRSAELFDASNSNAEYSRSLRVPFLNHFRHPVLLKHRNAHVRLHLCPLHLATLLLKLFAACIRLNPFGHSLAGICFVPKDAISQAPCFAGSSLDCLIEIDLGRRERHRVPDHLPFNQFASGAMTSLAVHSVYIDQHR